jgi:23S rRNA (adenine2503-C2)-methyltransferase
MTKIVSIKGREDLAFIYVLQLRSDPPRLVETVDSIDPRYPRSEKAVIILSTQFGCPVGCAMCDAGGGYVGNLTADEMLAQVDMVRNRRTDLLATEKLKIHFARMGEPSLNVNVLEALRRLPAHLPAPGLFPSISTVAPARRDKFFDELLEIRHTVYADLPFQLQFSIHSTDVEERKKFIPIRLMSLEEIADYGQRFHIQGQRKVGLNFALAQGAEVDGQKLKAIFDPQYFMIKFTPVNPTERAAESGMQTMLSAATPDALEPLADELRSLGYETIVSIGEEEEIELGTNCGQAVRAHHQGLAVAGTVLPQQHDRPNAQQQ